MDCALKMGGNLYQASTNLKWAASALDQINFKGYLTNTLNYGHIHGCDESDDLILPVYARDDEPGKTSDEPDSPLTMASVRSEGQFNSIIYETSDHYRNTRNRWAALMNPIDIAKLDKVTGDTATIKSAIGEMRDVTIYAFDVASGNELAY